MRRRSCTSCGTPHRSEGDMCLSCQKKVYMSKKEGLALSAELNRKDCKKKSFIGWTCLSLSMLDGEFGWECPSEPHLNIPRIYKFKKDCLYCVAAQHVRITIEKLGIPRELRGKGRRGDE